MPTQAQGERLAAGETEIQAPLCASVMCGVFPELLMPPYPSLRSPPDATAEDLWTIMWTHSGFISRSLLQLNFSTLSLLEQPTEELPYLLFSWFFPLFLEHKPFCLSSPPLRAGCRCLDLKLLQFFGEAGVASVRTRKSNYEADVGMERSVWDEKMSGDNLPI